MTQPLDQNHVRLRLPFLNQLPELPFYSGPRSLQIYSLSQERFSQSFLCTQYLESLDHPDRFSLEDIEVLRVKWGLDKLTVRFFVPGDSLQDEISVERVSGEETRVSIRNDGSQRRGAYLAIVENMKKIGLRPNPKASPAIPIFNDDSDRAFFVFRDEPLSYRIQQQYVDLDATTGPNSPLRVEEVEKIWNKQGSLFIQVSVLLKTLEEIPLFKRHLTP